MLFAVSLFTAAYALLPVPSPHCVSGTYPFKANRMYTGAGTNTGLKDFDFTVDYAPQNAKVFNGQVDLVFTKNPFTGTRVSTNQWIQYAKVSISFSSSPMSGSVTSFISMSPNGHEIDFEMRGE